MASVQDKAITLTTQGGVLTTDEKLAITHEAEFDINNLETLEQHLNVTEDDLLEAKATAASMTLAEVRGVSLRYGLENQPFFFFFLQIFSKFSL
jgi:hypothetical protein